MKSLQEQYPHAKVTPLVGYSDTLVAKSIKQEAGGVVVAHVGGVISDESKDMEGDRILQKALDTTYIEKGYGRIKYEHGGRDKDGNVKDLDEPERFIGVIDKVMRKGTRTEFEGRIIADPKTTQYKLAKAVIDDLQNLQTLNRLNPSSLQKKNAGWSIEAGVVQMKKSGKTETKAFLNNVVYTTKPVNTNSIASLVKSLEAGYGYNVADKTGGGAIRKESIDKNLKHQITINGEPKMKFNNEDHAYRHFLTKGLAQDEARTKAKQAMVSQTEEEDEEKNGLEALANGATESIKKSLGYVQTVLTGIEDLADPLATQRTTIAKSIVRDTEGGFDIGKFLKSVGDTQLTFGEQQVAMFQSQEQTLKALDGLVQMNKSLIVKSLAMEKTVTEIVDENQKLRKAIAMSDKGIVSVTGDENVFETNGDDKKVKKLNKALAQRGLRHLVNEGKIQQKELANFEAGVFSDARAQQVMDLYNNGTLSIQ